LNKVPVLILVCLLAVGVVMASGCTSMQNKTTNITQKAQQINQTVHEKINNTINVTNTAKNIVNNIKQKTGITY